MLTTETWRRSGARFWRVLVAHIVAVAMILSSVAPHIDFDDESLLSVGTAASVALDDGASISEEGMKTPLRFGSIGHAGFGCHGCGCHVGVPAAPMTTISSPVSTARSIPQPVDSWARPGPLALPFEPPRA